MSYKTYNQPFVPGAPNSGPQSAQSAPAEDTEEAVDFFSDMTPRIKKQKKVILTKRENPSTFDMNDKFQVDAKATISTSSVLGDLEDNYSSFSGGDENWETENIDVDSTLREQREAERQRRVAEHQRVIEQREREKKSRNKSLAATKLS
jgi:hypothetical protein